MVFTGIFNHMHLCDIIPKNRDSLGVDACATFPSFLWRRCCFFFLAKLCVRARGKNLVCDAFVKPQADNDNNLLLWRAETYPHICQENSCHCSAERTRVITACGQEPRSRASSFWHQIIIIIIPKFYFADVKRSVVFFDDTGRTSCTRRRPPLSSATHQRLSCWSTVT